MLHVSVDISMDGKGKAGCRFSYGEEFRAPARWWDLAFNFARLNVDIYIACTKEV